MTSPDPTPLYLAAAMLVPLIVYSIAHFVAADKIQERRDKVGFHRLNRTDTVTPTEVCIEAIRMGARKIQDSYKYSKGVAPPKKLLRLLRLVKIVCGEENRENVDLIEVELLRDIALLKNDGAGNLTIGAYVIRQIIFGTLFPIIWDETRRAVKRAFRLIR